MKFRVNENCIGCGMCAAICPEVFSISGEGTAVAVDSDVADAAKDSATTAMNSCPVGAIEEV